MENVWYIDAIKKAIKNIPRKELLYILKLKKNSKWRDEIIKQINIKLKL